VISMALPSEHSGGTAHVLPAERAKCSFDVEVMTRIFSSASADRDAKDSFKQLFSGEPFSSAEMRDYMSYEKRFEATLQRTAAAVAIVRDPKNRKFMMSHMAGKVQMGDMFETGGLGIHFTMFLTFIKTNASEEQQKVWLERAQEGRFFGAYAQTELGHGSNVRGLETVAIFDRETDEFVIHSPTLTSLKWWPTGMYACTHGVVMAQLVIDGKGYGFHGFMVQFRDDNGNLMPGVEVGELGPKINPDNTNIGYARFSHVRIPRFNMFAKFQQVTRDGNYVAPPPKLEKFRYISMMQIRMMLVGASFRALSHAATIAVRYSCVRRQGFKDTSGQGAATTAENAVIDYRVQQYRTFRALATAYCFYFSAMYMNRYLSRIQSAVSNGTGEERDSAAAEMPELHATLSGLKVWSTLYAHESIEDCRKACGGQGYLRSSGVCALSTDFTEPATVEGEQVILSLQTARFLIKAAAEAAAGRAVVGSVEYLKVAPLPLVQTTSWQGQTQLLLDLFRDRAARFARKLAAGFQKERSQGKAFDVALNAVAILAYKAAECHSLYVMVNNNHRALMEFVEPGNERKAAERLLDLLLLIRLREQAGDWLGVLTESALDAANDRINELLSEIRPDCVGLVDAFGWSDSELKSTLGRYDGNVYEAIYGEAKKSPLNENPKMLGWEHLQPILDIEFLREGMKLQRAGLRSAKL